MSAQEQEEVAAVQLQALGSAHVIACRLDGQDRRLPLAI